MRLTPEQITTIKSTAQSLQGEGVQVRLFSARVTSVRPADLGDIEITPHGGHVARNS